MDIFNTPQSFYYIFILCFCNVNIALRYALTFVMFAFLRNFAKVFKTVDNS